MNKTVKYISNIIYAMGVISTIVLGFIALWGSFQPINPDSMLPLSWRDQAFILLAMGAIPMLLACMAVYKFNLIKNSKHKKRTFIFLFLPGFVCTGCALFWIGILIIGYINMFLQWAS